MHATERIALTITEPLTWAEICERYPDEWVCIVDIDYDHPNVFDFRTARVVGHSKTKRDASEQARPWWITTSSSAGTSLAGSPYAPSFAPLSSSMTRLETPFAISGDLIIVQALVSGPRGTAPGQFVLDTGAAATTMVPELADEIGYGPRDGYLRTRVHTAIGREEGYVLRVAEFTVLGFALTRFPVNVFDLGHDDIDGLLGMNFLSDFNDEIRSSEHRILVERTGS